MLPLPGVVRRLALALAAGAVVAAPLAPAAARAEDPAATTVTGELVQAWPEAHPDEIHDHPAAAQPLTWVETPDGGAVRLRSDEVAGVPVGSTVEVTVGEQVADPTDESGVGPAHDVIGARVVRPPAAAAPPDRALTNEVTVVLVRPAGAPEDGVRPAQLAAAVDGPVADFWGEQTSGAIRLGVTGAHDWVATQAGCDEPAAMWNQAAAAVDFRAGPGRHLLVYVPGAAGDDCGYGLAEVGSLPTSGGRVYVSALLPSLIAHELGHNFGLGHSSALRCAGRTEADRCRTAGYRDHYDVMGGSWEQLGSLNVVQAARLGTLADGAVRTLEADGTATPVTLAPLSGTSGVRAVRLLAPGGRQYWLELRTAAGRDGWLADENRFGLQAGVLVRRSGTWPDTSLLLDPTPTAGPDGDLQTALPIGRPLSLAGGAFTVTVDVVGPDGASVRVRSATGATPPAPAAPDAAAPDVLPADDGATGSAPAAPPAPPVPSAPAPAAPPAGVARVAEAPGATAAGARAPLNDGGTAPAAPVTTREGLAGSVVPASAGRSQLLPAVAGAVLGGAGLLLVRRLVRSRARR